MDWQMAQVGVSAAMFLVGGGAGVYAWAHDRINRRRVSVDAEVATLKSQAHDIEQRVAVVEREQNNAPTHEDLGKIYGEVNSLARSLAELQGQIGRMAESLSRVESYLINRTGRSRSTDEH